MRGVGRLTRLHPRIGTLKYATTAVGARHLPKYASSMVVDQGPSRTLKRAAQWVAALVMTAGAILGFFLIVSTSVRGTLFKTLLEEHVRAIVGIPMAALSAFCLVTMLEATSGSITFRALGVEFHGASGPVVLWIFTFLAFTSAIRLLW
jgi:hypothetical protein